MLPVIKKLALLLMMLSIAACGFRLRGMADVPVWLNNIAIVIQDGHRDLAFMLKDQLQAYGVSIATSPASADYLLIIEKDTSQHQLTSVSASTTPRQYQLIYTVQYSLVKVNGKEPIASSNIVSVTRQLTVNNDRILGSDFEEGMINSEMRRDAAMQIINRLSRK